MKEGISILEYFSEVETCEEHNGYFCSVGEALTIAILGSLCGLRNSNQIHQWSLNQRTKAFLSERFKIVRIPCYYWFLCLLKLIKPESLNLCFIRWAQTFFPERGAETTISFDGKSIRSTGKMSGYTSPLHIISAHLANLGITIGQQTAADKSNEIPAMRELLRLLEVEGCMIVADALHCQKETAKAIAEDSKADYLLSVKDNQPSLKEDIADYVQDAGLRGTMDYYTTCEKNSGRVERREAYATSDIGWLYGKEDWAKLACIGAVHTQFTTKKGTTSEWHYYISSRKLTAGELLSHARLEWSVESMHWLLDVHFAEDYCRVEDKNIQQNLNIIRKIALNTVRSYKDKTKSKLPLSRLMFDCLLDSQNIISVLTTSQN